MKKIVVYAITFMTVALPAMAQGADKTNSSYKAGEITAQVLMTVLALAVIWKIVKKVMGK